jgi:hypothetical protein
MTVDAVTTWRSLDVDLHGARIAIRCDHPRVLAALSSRLAPFIVSDHGDGGHDATFDICRASEDDWPSTVRSDTARVVYDSDLGEVLYSDGDDVLTIDCGSVRVVADLAQSAVRITYSTGADEELALAAHPLFTLPLLELLERRDRFSLHAACVARGDDGLLIAGASGSGKTTLSVALTLDGMSFLSDDMVFLAISEGTARVLGFPDELDLTDETVRMFPSLTHLEGRPKWGGRPKHQLRPDADMGATIAETCRPRALLLPHLTGARDSELERCSAAEALLELAPNVLLTQAESSQRHLDALGALVRTIPAYSLRLGRDLDHAIALARTVLA